MKPKILILGGAGMLGHQLWQVLSQRFENTYVTLRTSRSRALEISPLFDQENVIFGVDALNMDMLSKIITEVQPTEIINCIAVTKRHEKPDERATTIATNAWLPHALVSVTEKVGARVIHFSTDCVFDGEKGGYTENDLPNAKDLYGRSKALGEIEGSRALTLRTSFIGRELKGNTELVEWFLSQKGKEIQGFRQAIYTGLTTPVAARVVAQVIECFPNLHGLWQVASTPINKFELLQLLNESFHNQSTVRPSDMFVCRRNLDGSKFFRETGISIPSWREMILELGSGTRPTQKGKL